VDRDELWAVACVSPEEGIRLSLQASEAAWTWFVNGAPVCMFGVSPNPVLQGVGMPWMIGTTLLERHAMTFLRRCRPYLEEMSESFVLLQNYVDARNVSAIRWLKWLGFKFDSPQPTGPFGLPFHRFQMKRNFVYHGACANNKP
jgi:hypothetical protein